MQPMQESYDIKEDFLPQIPALFSLSLCRLLVLVL